MNRLAKCLLALCVIAADQLAQAATWTTIDHPDAGPGGTYPTGISGNNIAGYYIGQGVGQRGFLYNGSTFTTIEAPSPAFNTWASGIDGANVIGYYSVPTGPGTFVTHGFLLSGVTFATLDCTLPGAVSTLPTSIDGNKIAGVYYDQTGYAHGFEFDGTTYSALDDPLTSGSTFLLGVNQGRVVGYSDSRAFAYDGSAFQTLAPPQANSQSIVAAGIDDGNIVGYYDVYDYSDFPPLVQRNGFIFDGAAYKTINHPLAGPLGMTQPSDINGNRIVGSYRDAAGNFHGFIAVVPEPAAMCLALTVIPVLRGARNRRRAHSSARGHK